MDPHGIIWTIITVLVIGALGRLVVPGKQAMGWVLTIVVGIVAAIVGKYIANAIAPNSDLLQWVLQIGLAAVGVAIVGGTARRSSQRSLSHH